MAPSGTKLIDTEQIDLQCTGNGYPEPIVQVGMCIKIPDQ